jgi:RNA polymerase sigma factor (sigma-70 family)
MSVDAATEDLLRQLAPQVLGAVVRRYGNFALAEDATQEALAAAAIAWPADGCPANPKGWLIRVASRRLTDLLRADHARRRREERLAMQLPANDGHHLTDGDDTLILLFMCCHPALTPVSQIALTLRAVGGLTTREIARAFLTSEATIVRRITRAKQSIRQAGLAFTLPSGPDRYQRLDAVRQVLYLVFNEGYVSTSGTELLRAPLSSEAIRLARLLEALLPGDSETMGLLSLMLLTDARRPARVGPAGELISMAAQDRSRWDRAMLDEGTALITAALPVGPVGPFQLQAAIGAVHGEAASSDDTDWPQIVALYEVLQTLGNNPIVALNHAVAVAMADGPAAGLRLLEPLHHDARLADDHRLHSVRGHLLERQGHPTAAADAFSRAAQLATNTPQRRFLLEQARRLSDLDHGAS